jgi:hypothetical protein
LSAKAPPGAATPAASPGVAPAKKDDKWSKKII